MSRSGRFSFGRCNDPDELRTLFLLDFIRRPGTLVRVQPTPVTPTCMKCNFTDLVEYVLLTELGSRADPVWFCFRCGSIVGAPGDDDLPPDAA